MQLDQRFPARLRLRKRPEFIRCKQMGRKIHTSHFLVYALENDGDESRLGVTVSRRVGNAVVRNRVKRLVREFFRSHKTRLPAGFDLSVIARHRAGELDQKAVCRELGVLLKTERLKGRRNGC
ncbi:MAG: ribonuclease P protein component [Deltaproteobacteria bacterium]|nr:MAG: ribonuclease P protein component [Deltaproteobacteria bacterium]